MTAFTARALSTNRLQNSVNQSGHGFVVGNTVIFDGAAWVDSQASSLAECAGTCMVSLVLDADNFVVTQTGWVNNFDASLAFLPLTEGQQYYLDPTGGLTLTEPTTTGFVSLPCLIADTTTSGYFFGGSGNLIKASQLFAWETVTTNTNMVVNRGYFINGGASIDMLLPPTAQPGDVIEIATLGTNGCVITQNALQSINIVDETSSVGAGGTVTLQSMNGVRSGGIRLVCMVADTTWKGTPGSGIWLPA